MINHWVATAWRPWARWVIPGGADLRPSLVAAGEATGAWLADSSGGASRIAWWEAEGIHRGAVADAGALLRRLRPADASRGRAFMEPVAPVTVQERGGDLSISLYTDLWFPRLLGLLDGWDADELPAGASFDNRALANEHTPALNAFLAEARALAASAGRDWELEEPEGAARHYADFTSLDGIDLAPAA